MFFKKTQYTSPSFTTIQGNQSGFPYIGSYDMALYKLGDRKGLPFLLGVSIQGYKKQENGLPDKSEVGAINSMEDKIIKTFNDNELGHYAGHSFWNGALELSFYISDPDKAIPIFQKLHKAKLAFPFAFKIDRDPRWKQFSNLIK